MSTMCGGGGFSLKSVGSGVLDMGKGTEAPNYFQLICIPLSTGVCNCGWGVSSCNFRDLRLRDSEVHIRYVAPEIDLLVDHENVCSQIQSVALPCLSQWLPQLSLCYQHFPVYKHQVYLPSWVASPGYLSAWICIGWIQALCSMNILFLGTNSNLV